MDEEQISMVRAALHHWIDHATVEQLERMSVFQGITLRPPQRAKREAQSFGVAAVARLVDQTRRPWSKSLRVSDHVPIRCPHTYQQVVIQISHRRGHQTVAYVRHK